MTAMPESELTQEEADRLLELPKHLTDAGMVSLPEAGQGVRFGLTSEDRREKFFLDLYRGRLNLAKRTHHTRARRTVPLARLCVGVPRHRNPGGLEVGANHLHLFRPGFMDKWAFEPPVNKFTDLTDPFPGTHWESSWTTATSLPRSVVSRSSVHDRRHRSPLG